MFNTPLVLTTCIRKGKGRTLSVFLRSVRACNFFLHIFWGITRVIVWWVVGVVSDWPYVFCWQPGYGGGVRWYRAELPLREYARQGGRCSHSGALTSEMYELADVVVAVRACSGAGGSVDLWREMCDRADKLMVYDIDDDLGSVGELVEVGAFDCSPEHVADVECFVRSAHVVTVSTPYLADRLSELNPNIHVVPNRVPAWLTEWCRPSSAGVTVGWGGTQSHLVDWPDVAPRVGRFLCRNEDVHFHAMGVWGVIDFTGWPSSRVRTTGWSVDAEEYYRGIDFDVGVIPLAPLLFNRSKTAIKALEYAALGIPVVASAYGPYEDFVIHGETGFLVRRDHEWEKYLKDLTQDRDLRAAMGQRARELAKTHTVEDNLGSWLGPWGVGSVPVQSRSDDEFRLLEAYDVLRHLSEAASGRLWQEMVVPAWLRALVPAERGGAPSEWLSRFVERANRVALPGGVAAAADVAEGVVGVARAVGESELRWSDMPMVVTRA